MRIVPTPVGDARVVRHPARTDLAPHVATVVLGHGAGRGTDTPDLLTLAERLPRAGIEVQLVDQPWVVAGRRVAAQPATLDTAWTAVLQELHVVAPAGPPLVVGGRSAGARVASRTAGAVGAAGVLALAFPLHPPGRPDRSRLDELVGCPVPVLVVQGSSDAFGRPAEFPADLVSVLAVAQADHSLHRGRPATQAAWDVVLDGVAAWIARLVS